MSGGDVLHPPFIMNLSKCRLLAVIAIVNIIAGPSIVLVQAEWIARMPKSIYSTAELVFATCIDSTGAIYIGGRCSPTTCNFHNLPYTPPPQQSTQQQESGTSPHYFKSPGLNTPIVQTVDMQGNGGGAYVAKYFANGTFAWRLKMDGQFQEYTAGCVVNSRDELVVNVIYYSMPVTVFDTRNQPVVSYQKMSPWSGLLLKFAANGTWQWGVRLTSLNMTWGPLEYFTSLSIGQRDEIVVTGKLMSAPLVIYGTDGQIERQMWAQSILSDKFALKLYPNGTVWWLTMIFMPSGASTGTAAIDAQGDVLYMGDTMSYVGVSVVDQSGTTTALPAPGFSAFLIKLSSANGSFVWYNRMITGPGAEYAMSVVTDRNSSIYTCGYFISASVTLEDVSRTALGTITMAGASGGFLIKYDRRGAYQWAILMDGVNEEKCNLLTVDSEDNVIAAGQSNSNSMSFLNVNNQAVRTINGLEGVASFVVKFDCLGRYLWSVVLDGQIDETPLAITTDRWNNVFYGGTSDSPAVSVYDTRARLLATLDFGADSDTWLLRLSENGSTYGNSLAHSTSTAAEPGFSIPGNVPLNSLTRTSSSRTHSLDVNRTPDGSTENSAMALGAIGAGIGAVLLFATVVGIIMHSRTKIKRELAIGEQTTATVKSESTSVTSITPQMTTSLMTAVVSNHELAIPAFLEMNYGTDFRQDKYLAKGGGGVLYTCSWLSLELAESCQRQPLVVKVISDGDIDSVLSRTKIAFFQEIAIMHRFRDHPLFCKVFAFSQKPVSMVMRLYELGDLERYINGLGAATQLFPYTNNRMVILIKFLAISVAHMHECGIAHCDLKPANTLLEARLIKNETVLMPILTDFGISRVVSTEALKVQAFESSHLVGASMSFAAPEVLLRLRRKTQETDPTVWKAGDTYALAVILLNLMSRRHPWI